MSNHHSLSRYNSIVSILRLQKHVSLPDLLNKLNVQEDKKISERTLQRDFIGIENLGIKINYSKMHKGYFIDKENSSHHVASLDYLLEAQEKIGILLQHKKFYAQKKQKIQFETTNVSNENNFLKLILTAFYKNFVLNLDYKSFENTENRNFEVIPLLLKQHKNRFYLIGKRIKDDRILTFALDRVNDMSITETTFKAQKFDLETYFEFTFGVTHVDANPEKIVLRVFDTEINYIKTLPLHHSQNIIFENEKFIDITILIVPNYEFENYILAIGEKIKVLEPLHFKTKIYNRIKNSLVLYDEL